MFHFVFKMHEGDGIEINRYLSPRAIGVRGMGLGGCIQETSAPPPPNKICPVRLWPGV